MQIDIRTLMARLNPECKRAMAQAAQMCVQQTHYNVEIEHLMLQLLDPLVPDAAQVLNRFELDPTRITSQLQQGMERFKRGNARTPALSPHFSALFQEAWLLSSMLLGQQQVRSGTLLLALLEVDSLRGLLLEMAPALLEIPRETLRQELPALLDASTEDAGRVEPGSAPSGPAMVHMPQSSPAKRSLSPSLDQFTVDLTAQAQTGQLDPVQGRDAEIRQIIDILLRRRQNNPLLAGEAGVGKTAVVEGLAQRIVQGRVPPGLAGVRLRALDLGLLQAGAGIKGEFENRIKSVIAEVAASTTPVILFIDEAHQLIGAGGAEGQGDAANLLKPALARGQLRTIAATTWAEYKKYVERDPALARRFQVVKIEEPSEQAAVQMLRGMTDSLERHHGVEILDEAVQDAVRLSHRYIAGRQLPDKAISVLDTACARVAVGLTGEPAIVESVGRDIDTTEQGLRMARAAHARGEGPASTIAHLEHTLANQRQHQQHLRAKLNEERQAVHEIQALRRQIAAQAQDPAGIPIVESERLSAGAQLQRLHKGLEAIQADEPLVPLYVNAQVVADVISGWTGIPVGKMMADEVHTVLQLRETLALRVVGQDAALDAIARRIRTFHADLDDPGKPVGVFLLVGPSGVGKTETACALADLLYGGERNMITLNMSEFQEAHSVSSLKGAPPGYVGYGKGGVLTEAVRRRPYSVVLLDEIEKAHRDILELFFQVFDKGTMEDGEGVSIDFRNTLILLTSNAAQDVITQACEDDRRPDPAWLVERLRPVLLQQLSPAFLGRLVLVPYYPLGDDQLRRIVQLKLRQLAQRFTDQHASQLTWDDTVSQAITARCKEVESGARNIDFLFTQTVLPELASLVLERICEQRPFDAVHMSVDGDGQFIYVLTDASPVMAQVMQ